MKEYKKEIVPIVRIQFGKKVDTHSISFTDTTVEEVMDVAVKVFKEHRITKTIVLENASPLSTIMAETSILMHVREEQGSRKMNGSKSKSLYGLTAKEAFEIFKNNYKKFI